LRSALAATPRAHWIVQPYLAGDLGAVVGVAWRGQIVCAAHQVAERLYPPDCGVSAYARTIPREPELELGVRRLIELLGWSGIFQVQTLETAEGRQVIDVNLRAYGSLALVVAAGLNLPAIWTGLLLGRPVTSNGYRVGVRYRSEERDVGALARAISRGEWRVAAGGLRPRAGTAHAVFSLHDPLPVLSSLHRVTIALSSMGGSSRNGSSRNGSSRNGSSRSGSSPNGSSRNGSSPNPSSDN